MRLTLIRIKKLCEWVGNIDIIAISIQFSWDHLCFGRKGLRIKININYKWKFLLREYLYNPINQKSTKTFHQLHKS